MPFRTLQGDALAKAIRLNPKYAFETGWIDAFWIVDAVLKLSPNPGAEELANAVFGWQLSQSDLKGDGILGPNTWDAMRHAPIPSQPGRKPAPKHLEDTPAKDVRTPTAGGRPNSGVWVGLLITVGGFTGAAGRDLVVGTMYSIDDRNRSFDALSNRVRLGFGADVSISAATAIISNLYNKKRLQGLRTSGYDFSVSLGPKWSSIFKSAVKTPRIVKVIDRFDELIKAGESGRGLLEKMKYAARQAARLQAEEYAKLARIARESKSTLDALHDKKPVVSTLTLPMGAGYGASVFYQDDKWYVAPSSGML